MFLVILALAILVYLLSIKKCPTNTRVCVKAHSENGFDYPWLNDIHGGLDFIEYKEPGIGAVDWTRYNDATWEAHCSRISHSPENLVDDHRRVFLVPNSPIKLRFHFKDGTVEELQDTERHLEYYRLEADYFRKNNSC